ncbi:hypothetical protein AK812_SmicGene2541 [Symbiodinium microadriaticum]|uniref:Uncharacterized protein n=1 Tax=Symbiodinium microadriaticum TaxID=2951 RepID=A0A1Q9F1I1_SYMMI|nr:hypothetical protein AK812_SmicGene2541 [Symbiodinium microadriaticum]
MNGATFAASTPSTARLTGAVLEFVSQLPGRGVPAWRGVAVAIGFGKRLKPEWWLAPTFKDNAAKIPASRGAVH